jgi:hypothetical protein
MSKIYLSRSISRSMSADHPVGDPTGGAAYGEKNDPVSAILSVAAMGGTYATAGTFAAMTVMQGITFAGAALSLVGNVTGNKTLSKIGMVAGIAGGLGQLAGIQGPTLGETFGGSAPAGGSGTAAGAMSSKSGSGSLSQSQAQSSGNVAAGGSYADEVAAQTKITEANMAARGGSVRGPAGMPASPQASPGYTGGSDYTSNVYNQSLPGKADLTGAYADVGLKSATEPGFFSQAWEGTKELASGLNPITNPYGAMAVGQIAAPIADYLSGKTDAEIAALEAQTGYADQRALQMQEEIAKEKRRRENLAQGYAQVDTGINVNPNASMAQQGLIAQQLQQA